MATRTVVVHSGDFRPGLICIFRSLASDKLAEPMALKFSRDDPRSTLHLNDRQQRDCKTIVSMAVGARPIPGSKPGWEARRTWLATSNLPNLKEQCENGGIGSFLVKGVNANFSL